MEITPFYDSMLAKLIVHGSNRQQALRRMVRVLQELHVGGILTSAGVALEVIQSQPFQDGEYDTGYLERFREDEKAKSDFGDLEEVAALVAVMHRMHTANSKRIQSHSDGPGLSAWLQESRRQQMRGGR
jgi:acetyl/propionyl-CoA carboxylase alpha subunit